MTFGNLIYSWNSNDKFYKFNELSNCEEPNRARWKMKSKTKTGNRWLIKELEDKEVNIRSCETLFDIFLKACGEMKLSWNDDWNTWTKKILGFFGDFGQFLNYCVHCGPQYGIVDSEKKPTSEYLVDLCWCFEDEYSRANWIELALESELSGQTIDSITYDFWKLTDLKAYIKVGVFAPKLKDKQQVLEAISALVAYHGIQVLTEKYLIILILNHGQTESPSKQIEIVGYEISYLGNIREIGSKRFPKEP